MPRARRVALHAGLFALTFVSMLLAQTPLAADEGPLELVALLWRAPARLGVALPFAATLAAILLAHEMGHFCTARRLGVRQSWPYFIPAPLTLFGTMGAVIVMRTPPRSRRDLLAVAAMGPWAGLALALPAAAWGLAHSQVVRGSGQLGEAGVAFGDSLLFAWLTRLCAPAAALPGADVVLHPVAVAGWVGLMLTSLNLIPAAQLDGGHIAYALLGRHQEKLSLGVAVALFYFGLHAACVGDPGGGPTSHGGAMWLLWSLVLFAMGIRHPPVGDDSPRLRGAERLHAVAALLVCLVTFVPVPLREVAAAPAGAGEEIAL